MYLMLNRGSVLEMDVVVGQDTKIGEGTTVTQSVIGSNCEIGSNVKISHAYIWDNVVIKVNRMHKKHRKLSFITLMHLQDNCQIDVALIADGVILNEGVELGRGCVIGPEVVLSAGTKVLPNIRLMNQPPPKCDNDFETSDEENGLMI